MQLFLDTADVQQIEQRFSSGLIAGVTTNPSLIKKSGKRPTDVYKKLVDIGVEDISMEVVGADSRSLVKQGLNLIDQYGSAATIKLPCSIDGLKACNRLTEHGVRVNMTLVFSVSQAILCSIAGATYVSPFIGRLDDNSLTGLSLIADIGDLYKKQEIKTQILAASVRDVQSVGKAFELGANICTIPPKVFDGMADHVLTDVGLAQFEVDFLA